MALPPLLFMRRRTGPNQAALRYTAPGSTLTSTQIGDSFGTTETVNVDHTPQNHTIHFQGNVYSVGSDGVYQKDDPTMDAGSYTRIVTFISPDTTNGRFSGLYAVNVEGVPYLTMIYGTTTGTSVFRGVKYDGTSWSQTAEITTTGSIDVQYIKAEIVWRNQLHIIGMFGATVNSLIWNPITEIISSPTNSFGNGNVGLCVFNDRLFAAHTTGNNMVASISEFTGKWTIAVNGFTSAAFSATGAPPTVHSGNQCLFTDGTNMYCMVSGLHDLAQGMLTAGEGGWRCFQFDSNLTPTNITTTVLPANLRAAADGGSGGSGPMFGGVLGPYRDRFFSLTDIDTAPGSQTTWLLYAALGPIGATTFTLYQWNGPGSMLTLAASGGNSDHSVMSLPTFGGEYIWQANDLDVWVTGVASDASGVLIRFKASGDSGPSNKTVTFRVGIKGEPALGLATLTGSATGGSAARSGNSVINVNADGSTEYTVTWSYTSDVPAGDWRAGLVPFIV